MALDKRSGPDRSAAVSTAPRRLISRFAPILNRPLVIGGLTVLASFVGCGALARSAPVPEGKQQLAPASSDLAPSHRSDRSDDIPLLFLAAIGLGGLALSQTRPTERPGQRPGSLCAGKNVARGQELPAVIPPQPPLGVVARQHQDNVVGFEPVGGVRMLNQ
jgi:hypothetical protein